MQSEGEGTGNVLAGTGGWFVLFTGLSPLIWKVRNVLKSENVVHVGDGL